MSTYAEKLLFERIAPQGDWVREALCAQSDQPDLWFPPSSSSPRYQATLDEAKAICARCPVRNACLDWALKSKEPHGIFGGISAKGRGNLRRNTQ